MNAIFHDAWPVVPLVLPVLFLVAGVFLRLGRTSAAVLGFLPIPSLAAAVFGVGTGPVVVTWLPWQPAFAIDLPGALLLGTAALLWSAAGLCVPAFLGEKSAGRSFCFFWTLTLLGSLGAFLAADLPAFLVCYVLVSLPAYALIVAKGDGFAQRAGFVYLGFAVLAEAVLLMGFVMLTLSAPDAGLGIKALVGAMAVQGAWGNLTLGLLIAAFGMKIALVPFHFWMPLAHSAAPTPVSAVLSGAVVKAGIIGIIRFVPFGDGLPAFGQVLVVLGFTGAFFGVLVGVTQQNPKAVLAYSTISQTGFLAAVFGAGMLHQVGDIAAMASFYAAHHVLVKGALFVAVGLAATHGSPRKAWLWAPAAILGLSLAGLPLTGGSLAKEAVKDAMSAGWMADLSVLSAIASAFLMWHFLERLTQMSPKGLSSIRQAGVRTAWFVLAAASVAVPWLCFAPSGFGLPSGTLAPLAIWSNLWPVLAGGALAWIWKSARRGGTEIPVGDVVVLGGPLSRTATAGGAWAEHFDAWLRHWPVACLALLLLLAALVAGAWAA